MRLPEVTGYPLPEILAAGIIDPEVFHTGYAIMAARYEQFGIRLLPLERVWAGTCSAAGPGTSRGHGGFHYPGQGYRHIQMDAAVTADRTETALLPDHPYARALGRFARTVTLRYRALLSELDASPAEAHNQIVTAMISGDLAPLEAWLDARHGLGSFARMFRSAGFAGESGLVT